MTLREMMEKMGASKAQLESNTLKMVEEALAEDEGIKVGAVNDLLKKMAKSLDEYGFILTRMKNESESIKQSIAYVDKVAEEYVEARKDMIIEDSKSKDAVLVYANILETTKEIFGEENMTEDVMITAIQAGSYGLWRSIMGGKDED